MQICFHFFFFFCTEHVTWTQFVASLYSATCLHASFHSHHQFLFFSSVFVSNPYGTHEIICQFSYKLARVILWSMWMAIVHSGIYIIVASKSRFQLLRIPKWSRYAPGMHVGKNTVSDVKYIYILYICIVPVRETSDDRSEKCWFNLI